MTKFRRERLLEQESMAVNPLTQLLMLLFLLTVILIPIVFFYGKNNRDKKVTAMTERARAAFETFVGSADYFDSCLVIVKDNPFVICASAIAIKDDHLFVLESSGVATGVPWSDVRSWKWKKAGFEQIRPFRTFHHATDISTAMQVNAANNAAARQAARDSGIFISLASVDIPEIVFQCDSEDVLRKWHEILTQKREGRTLA
jgi:hypothetical protein